MAVFILEFQSGFEISFRNYFKILVPFSDLFRILFSSKIFISLSKPWERIQLANVVMENVVELIKFESALSFYIQIALYREFSILTARRKSFLFYFAFRFKSFLWNVE